MSDSDDYRKGYISGFKAAMSLVPHRWCSGEKIREYMREALSALPPIDGEELDQNTPQQ